MTEFSDTSASQAVLNDDDTNPELAAMQLFSDTALRAAVEPSLSPAEQWRLHHLNATAGERELTSAEKDEQQALIAAYNRSVLRRAKALAILAQRGHDLTGILRVRTMPGSEVTLSVTFKPSICPGFI